MERLDHRSRTRLVVRIRVAEIPAVEDILAVGILAVGILVVADIHPVVDSREQNQLADEAVRHNIADSDLI